MSKRILEEKNQEMLVARAYLNLFFIKGKDIQQLSSKAFIEEGSS